MKKKFIKQGMIDVYKVKDKLSAKFCKRINFGNASCPAILCKKLV